MQRRREYAEDMQQTVPKVKQKDKGKGSAAIEHKEMKAHRVSYFYTLTGDDMDRISYQVWDVAKEEIEEASRK